MDIKIDITSNANAVKLTARQMRSRWLGAMRKALDLENAATLRALTLGRMGYSSAGAVQADGLRRISSTAVRSLRYTPAVNSGDGVASSLGSNLRYVSAHEFGFVGTVFVRAHNRRIFRYGAARLVRFVNPVTRAEGTQTRRSRRQARDAGGNLRGTTVVAHEMKMNLPARHMIRDTLIERIPAYQAAIVAGIDGAWEESWAGVRNARLEPAQNITP